MDKNVFHAPKVNFTTKPNSNASVVQLDFTLTKSQNLVNAKKKPSGTVTHASVVTIQNIST